MRLSWIPATPENYTHAHVLARQRFKERHRFKRIWMGGELDWQERYDAQGT